MSQSAGTVYSTALFLTLPVEDKPEPQHPLPEVQHFWKERSLFCLDETEWGRSAFLKPFRSYHEAVGSTDQGLVQSANSGLLGRGENIFLKLLSNSMYKNKTCAYIYTEFLYWIYLCWIGQQTSVVSPWYHKIFVKKRLSIGA